jgi:hypothetical protein
MHVKKTIARLAVAGSLVTAGMAVTGTAWASTPGTSTTAAAATPNSPFWAVYSSYSDWNACEAEGDVLLIQGVFSSAGPLAFKCVGNGGNRNYNTWVLWVEWAY